MLALAKGTETAGTSADRFALIWTIVEAGQEMPKLLVVASASASDDTERLARGIARAAHDAGQSAAYLYLGTEPRKSRESTSAYAELTLPVAESARASFDAAIKAWREAHDVIIVELPALAGCGLGAHVARLSDGVVVAVCPTRKVIAADGELKALLLKLRALIIGVVKTAPASPAALPARTHDRALSPLASPVRQQ